MNSSTLKQKMSQTFRKYGYYVLLVSLVLATVVTLVIVSATTSDKSEDSIPTNTTITPYMPVLNATLYKGYYGDELIYNSTLKQWETHNGVDLQVASGSNVYSILDGEVTDVYSNVLEGNVVVIEHNDGLKSCYGSLDNNLSVKVGDKVSRGDIIGVVANSANAESDAGAHLHFSMQDDNGKIDPEAYLNITNK